jgi:YVTN family beta-propeller protein
LKQTIGIANSFAGVAFSPDGTTIYVGGGASNDVKIFKMTGDVFAAAGTIPISGGPQPSGLTLNADGSRLYVALNQTNEVGIIDTASKAVTRVKAGTYPYTTVISADGRKVYVSNWGGKIPGPGDFTDGQNPVIVDSRTGIPASGTVSVLDTATNTIVKQIDVGLHPIGCMSRMRTATRCP